jgi:N-acetylneuraminic acid mutarotase
MIMRNQKTLILLALILLPILGISSEAWNVKSNFGGVGRHRGTGIAIGNRGYIGLGHYNGAGPNIMFADWWEFDPGTNTWSQKANYPFPTYAAASFTVGMKGYVGAGVSAGNQFYTFDPIANTWTAIQPVPLGATDQVGFAVNGKGYYLYSNTLYEYNPGTNTWTTKNNAPFSPSSWSSSFTIAEKAYVKSGGSLYEYKPTTDEWAVRAAFPGLATGGSAAFAVKGKGYIVCGYIGWLSELSDEVWEFDPATNSWTQMDEFPGTGRRFSSGFAIGDKGYVGIGTNGTNMRDFWEFDELLSVHESETVKVELYPNPATDYITISSQQNILINLFDCSGKLIFSSQLEGSEVFDVSDLENGTYFLECLAQDSRFVQKIIIQK